MKKFFLTTAIDYANGSPHLGHAYEKVLTDVVARTMRLEGREVHFLTGLDEHGQKVQQGAKEEGIPPQERCDRIADEFQEMLSKLEISNDDYIRTTETRHQKVVGRILQLLFDKGEIYKAEYQGFYSTRAEQFLQEKDKVDGEWPEIFGEVTEITETNYFFKLSKYQNWLVEHIKTKPEFILPAYRQSQVLEFLKEPLNDLCISRPKDRLSWGIPLPFDEDFVTYVWFDALVNYYSAVSSSDYHSEDYWPADLHVIGKDILTPPHAVYWPIMLQASELALPKSILAHGWWTTSGEKMSKSTGETVDPLSLIDRYGTDAFRYFVMREMTVGQDAEFSLERFESRYRADLGNDLGNLLSRLLHMVHSYEGGIVPTAEVNESLEEGLQSQWEKSRDSMLEHFREFRFNLGLEETFSFIRSINKYADDRTPWKLAKSDEPDAKKELRTCLATMLEALRLASVAISPVMPQVHAQIHQRMNLEPTKLWKDELGWGSTLVGKKLQEKIILFPRK
jgi:methionyl-tRNA synthetase